MRPSRQRLLALLGATGAAVLVTAGVAAAHVEPDPSRVKPGKTATVAFTVEHGCNASPTVELTFQVPKAVTAKSVKPQPKDGWETKVDGRTVVFTGGPLDAGTGDSFSITFKAPHKKTILKWKVVQQCEEGVIRWIDTAPGAENPPPAVGVGKNAPQPDTNSGH